MKQIKNNAKVYSFERKMEDGSIDYVTGVILPVKITAKDNISAQISNVFAVWNDKKSPEVMSATQTFENKTLNELTLSRVGENGEILSTQIVGNGSLQNTNGEIFSTSAKGSFWTCVRDKLIDDCLCSVLGIVCPPGTPSICDFCLPLLTPCYYAPSVITCSPAAVCLGIELAVVMARCY